MQTIINKASRVSKRDNLVLITSDLRALNDKYLEKSELEYIRNAHKEFKKFQFAFNRMNKWDFVRVMEKERSKDLRLENYRRAGACFAKELNENRLNRVTVVDLDNDPENVLAFAEGLALSNYQFIKYKKDQNVKINSLNQIDIYSGKLDLKAIDDLNIMLDGTFKCRNLVNEPVVFLNAVKFAEEMESMSKASGAKVEILNKKKIESLKMGGLLAVNKGSVDPPTFTTIEWKPEKPVNKKPYVFVGKGVVYDTGGMNIKTGDYMNNMKMDMAGGAAVVSAVYAISMAKLPVHVIALVPATDNRTDGNAYVSGDIITMHDGTRVEVINTDAEGRLILADALSYAKKFNPELVINVATLTGSAARAIGKYGIVAMQSKADREFRQLKKTGETINEKVVEFPLWKDYEDLLKSDIADIKNLGGVEAGAITAGKFLQHFTAYPFIHLDIAGTAFTEKPYHYYPSGGTGITVRLLFNFIKNKI
ncbi:MAG: leucyl aminopeptidase [Bacteroidales bacterium]|nr:leucyl aminopeptidase [Bacteroidales bacterium]